MNTTHDRIIQSQGNDSPFPHRILDGVFEPERFAEALRQWPERELFVEAEPGHYNFCFNTLAKELSPEQRSFWYSFLSDDCSEIIRGNLAVYGDVFLDRFDGEIEEVIFGGALLMEGDEDNPLRGVAVKHQHHYHDPLWLFTILIYFDEDRYTPTALYGWDNGREAQDLDYLARVACQSRHWRLIEELREQVVIDCTPNRMVSFIDGPLSIHCAKSELCEKPERQSRRRALRIHVSAPPKYAVHIYNAGLEDVRAALFEPTTEPLPLAWMKRDIDTIYRPHGNKPSGAAISFSSRVKLPEWRTAFCPDKIDSSWSAHKTTEVVERKAPSLKGAFRRLMDVARRV